MIRATVVALLFFACSRQQDLYLSKPQGCTAHYSCSSCSSNESCSVTSRSADGYVTGVNCCSK